MDGVEGFEPPNNGTKNRCLTAWPYPKRCYTLVCVDGIIEKNMGNVKGFYKKNSIILPIYKKGNKIYV